MTEGLRKRRQHFFVQVPRDTIRDSRLSFRARGLLAYLLDMPDGWDVKSENLADKTTEGRDAVRTALSELAKHGYYRIERRRMLTGRFSMGTAVSEEPVAEWVTEHLEYEGKAVMCIQQPDGTFLVRRKDGTLVDDGFMPPEPPTGSGAAVDVASDDPESGPSDQSRPPAPGNQAPVEPSPGEPASGGPASGQGDALREREKGDARRERTTGALAPLDPPAQTALTLVPDEPVVDTAPTAAQEAARIVRAWVDWHAQQAPVLDKQRTYLALVKAFVKPALESGYTAVQVQEALKAGGAIMPSKARFRDELVRQAGVEPSAGVLSPRMQQNLTILQQAMEAAASRDAADAARAAQ